MQHQKFTTILLTSMLALSLSSLPDLVLAQASSTRVGLPGRRVGGGTRGNCSFGQKQLTALMPKNNLALTVATNPELFFYIPATSESQTLEFVLRDEADNQVYEKTVKTNGTAGVISLNVLDAPFKELAIGKKYQWYLSIICNAQDRADDISVDGWVQRVQLNPTLAQQLKKATPAQRADIYAAAGLWQDALVTLAQLRQSHPQDAAVATKWAQILRAADLDNIAQEPIFISQH